jgi:hypothetical protein
MGGDWEFLVPDTHIGGLGYRRSKQGLNWVTA